MMQSHAVAEFKSSSHTLYLTSDPDDMLADNDGLSDEETMVTAVIPHLATDSVTTVTLGFDSHENAVAFVRSADQARANSIMRGFSSNFQE